MLSPHDFFFFFLNSTLWCGNTSSRDFPNPVSNQPAVPFLVQQRCLLTPLRPELWKQTPPRITLGGKSNPEMKISHVGNDKTKVMSCLPFVNDQAKDFTSTKPSSAVWSAEENNNTMPLASWSVHTHTASVFRQSSPVMQSQTMETQVFMRRPCLANGPVGAYSRKAACKMQRWEGAYENLQRCWPNVCTLCKRMNPLDRSFVKKPQEWICECFFYVCVFLPNYLTVIFSCEN